MDRTDANYITQKNLDLENWVETYTKDLLSWAYYKTSDKVVAEDLVQNVFLAATDKYSSFKGDSEPKTWLFAILNNKISEHFRKLYSRGLSGSIYDETFDNFGKWKENSKPKEWLVDEEENLLDNPEFTIVWNDCIEELPDLQSACIRLKFINGLDSKIICKDLNISASNYWQLLHRGKLLLRKCLENLWFNK